MITHMAEAVGRGHLDKVADTLSDLLVDKIVSQDPLAYVAIDACVGRGCVVLSGCVRGRQACDMAGLQVFVQEWLPCQGLGCDLQIIWNIKEEKGPPSFSSPQQAMCVGYATAETPQLMPFSHQIAQLFAQGIGAVTGIGPYLKLMVLADDTMGSCRVFVRAQGSEADRPALEADILRVCEHILLRQKSTQKVSLTCIFDKMPFAERLASSQGLTGRKTTQDAYGPTVPFTGGAFSGKSAHHLDRSGNYMARYVAKNIVSQGIAHTCLVELAYTESSVMPLQRQVTLDGRVLGAGACAALLGAYEPLMTLEACVAFFGLTRLSMAPFSCFGHFGTTAAAPWECLNSADFDQHEISHHV